MDKPSYIRNFGMKAWVILVELLLLVSCNNAIYDDEGDCSVTYHLKFRYDMNMKFADAFTHEVKSVSFMPLTLMASWCGKLTNRVKSLHPVITP